MTEASPPAPELGVAIERARARLGAMLATEVAGGELLAEFTAEIRAALEAHVATVADEAPTGLGGWVLLATGGMARGEHSPYSDLDLVLLSERELPEDDESFGEWMRALLHPIWDAGLRASTRVHTPAGWLDEAAKDLPACTSLLDLDPLGGDASLAALLQSQARDLFFDDQRESFLDRLEEEARERHARYGATVYLVEPDLKFGAGGTRDLALVQWALTATYGSADFSLLAERKQLPPRAAAALTHARHELLRLRACLHIGAGRATDRLAFPLQEGMPGLLGMLAPRAPDEPVADGELVAAIESMMQGYYRAALDLRRYGRRVFGRCRPARPGAGQPVRAVEGPFVVDRDRLRLRDDQGDPFGRFASDAALALHAVRVARDEGVALSGKTYDAILEAMQRSTSEALADDERAQALFADILVGTDEGARVPAVSLCLELGILERIVPEFAPSRGRMQHDSYHVYTVDQHAIYAVEFLKGVLRGQVRRDYPLASALHLEIDDLRRLYLATLLHDVGKPFGDQTGVGSQIARAAAQRLGLEEEDADAVAKLVEHHATMPMLSQKRDLADPDVVTGVTKMARDVRFLSELYLVSLADMANVSPDYLTGWKATLLDEIYLRAAAELRRGRIERPVHAEDPQGLPERYYSLFDPELRREHQAMVERIRGGEAGALVDLADAAGGLRLTVVCLDRPGLLAGIAAVLDEFGLGVIAADVFSTPGDPEVAIDIFRLEPAEVREEVGLDQETLAALQSALAELVEGEGEKLRELVRQPLPLLSPIPGRRRIRVPTRIAFQEDEAQERTIVEVQAADDRGVLRRICTAFALEGIDVQVARIGPGERGVSDVFYVPLLPDLRRDSLHARLEELLLRRGEVPSARTP